MNFNTHDNFVLVAPRPVRLAAPGPSPHPPFAHFQNTVHRPPTRVSGMCLVADGVDRLKLGEDTSQQDLKPSESSGDPASPRASPRANLSSEALEEFLSILQSSTLRFPPTSPIHRASNANVPNAFFYRRPTPSTLSPSLSSEGLGLSLSDPTDDIRKDTTTPAYPFMLIGSGPLASPVSRSQTRNPFQRHSSYESSFTGIFRPLSVSPGPVSNSAATLSPSAVPLPLPTPDEMDLETVS